MLTSSNSLFHDVTDKKYTKESDQGSKLTQILREAGVHEPFATAVVAIVNNVSYSTEIRDPDHTQSILKIHPELGIVQDADRLDAIGAIGVGRAFTFGGAKLPLSDMQLSRDHMTEKLEKLGSMMKVISYDFGYYAVNHFTNTPVADGYGKEVGNRANAEDSHLFEVVG